MLFVKSWTTLALAVSAVALPTFLQERAGDSPSGSSAGLDYLLFDSLAFPDPANPSQTSASFQAYVSKRRTSSGLLAGAIITILKLKNIDVVGDQVDRLKDRIKLIPSIGFAGEKVKVDVVGCTQSVTLKETSELENLGLVRQTASLGLCKMNPDAPRPLATVKLPNSDRRKISATIFHSPNGGYGVISDIDDTVKISNVLDTNALIRSTLLDEPKAVPGMPQLYDALSRTLVKPQFVYVSGSPYQLYPFLRKFINAAFASAQGPIMLHDLTIVDPTDIFRFVVAGSETAYNHKIESITKLQGFYPNKKWMMIGDSTQKDPEVYGEMRFKDANILLCAWIRKVDNAVNTNERFEQAFKDVPKDKWWTYTDAQIPQLAGLKVKEGQCRGHD